VDFPQSMLALVQQTLALQGRIGATRLYVTPDAIAIANNNDSAGLTVRFTENGYVLALYAQEAQQATAASYAGTGLRLQFGGTQDFAVDGNGGPAYPSLLGLVGGVNNWFPMMRRVEKGELYIVTFRNRTGAPITPQATFAFIADVDLEKMSQDNAGR
jgi:hypothetical protein